MNVIKKLLLLILMLTLTSFSTIFFYFCALLLINVILIILVLTLFTTSVYAPRSVEREGGWSTPLTLNTILVKKKIKNEERNWWLGRSSYYLRVNFSLDGGGTLPQNINLPGSMRSCTLQGDPTALSDMLLQYTDTHTEIHRSCYFYTRM